VALIILCSFGLPFYQSRPAIFIKHARSESFPGHTSV
jgi:hypothetical protein